MPRALGILLLTGLLRPLMAEEPPRTFRVEVGGIVRVDDVSDEVHGTARAILGPIRFSWPGLYSIEAERLLIWFDPRVDTQLFRIIDRLNDKSGEIPIWAIRAIYAEGRGEVPLVFQAAGQVLRASSMYYDLQQHQGLFLGTELRVRRESVGPVEEDLPDLVFRAKQFRARGPGRWSANDVSLFNSDYVKPEVELRIRQLEIENEQVRRAVGKLMLLSARGESTMGGPTPDELAELDDELGDVAETQRGTWGTMEGISVRGFGVPLFGWKRMNLNGGSLDKTVLRFQAGRIQSMGQGIYVAGGKRSRPIGWLLGGGYIRDRGPMFDTQIELDTWDGRATGRTVASYFRDNKQEDFDGFVPPSKDRYWIQNRYRFDLLEKLRFDVEYTLLSDERYLRIYDEREYKEGKDQESLGYLRWKDSWFYGAVIYQWQSIDFLTVKEQLPSARLNAANVTLLRLGHDGQGRPILLQLGVDALLGNFRYRGGADDPDVSFRTPRFDLDPTLFVSFNVGPVRFTPFATFRYTWYDETLDNTSANRYAGSAGLRADMQLSRWFGSVQHIVNFMVEYQDMYSVTVDSSDIFQMDPIDAIAPWEGFIARMRNRFLKQTTQGRREFLNFELLGTWFPNGDAPLGVKSDGYMELDLQWYPARGWLVETRAEYFSNDGTLQTASVVGRWGANQDLSFWAGFRHLHDDSDVLTGGGEFLVEDRWRIVLFSQYDIRNDDALDQTLLLQRMGKTFLIGFRIKYHPGEDLLAISFKFDLLERFRADRRKRAEDELRREVRYFPRNGG